MHVLRLRKGRNHGKNDALLLRPEYNQGTASSAHYRQRSDENILHSVTNVLEREGGPRLRDTKPKRVDACQDRGLGSFRMGDNTSSLKPIFIERRRVGFVLGCTCPLCISV
jgi:hypothetical protein